MTIRFNADEVLKMAERLENNSSKFYRRAAELQSVSTSVRQFFLKLAAMEDQHEATFAAMRNNLPAALRENTAFDPYMEANLYLSAMADARGGEGSPAVTDALTGHETAEQILRAALQMEEKAIVFFLGLKDMVPASLGQGQVEAILAEEKSHLTTLAQELRKLKA